jgi:hypothetical protein
VKYTVSQVSPAFFRAFAWVAAATGAASAGACALRLGQEVALERTLGSSLCGALAGAHGTDAGFAFGQCAHCYAALMAASFIAAAALVRYAVAPSMARARSVARVSVLR